MAFRVYVTRRIPQPGLDVLAGADAVVEINPHDRNLTHDELVEAVRGRDGVLAMLADAIDDAVLAAAAPPCRVVANYAVGFNNVDIAAATKRGVLVTNTPGVLTETTADLAWAGLMAIARRIVEGDRLVRSGGWDGWAPMQLLGGDVHGATLGVVGAGRIGEAVARRGTGFAMRLLYTSRRASAEFDAMGAKQVSLDELLRESDFVSLHVPLTPETRHMIDAAALAKMKPTAYLINTARGPVVDEAALVEALRARRIAGAALDVYEHEPKLTPGLADLDNVVCIPHLGSGTLATRSRMAVMAAENLVAALRGERPPNLVNTDVMSGRG